MVEFPPCGATFHVDSWLSENPSGFPARDTTGRAGGRQRFERE